MKIKIVLFLLAATILGCLHSTEAQQPGKVPRIGMLVSGSVTTHGQRIEAFRKGLRELGYVEGKNVIIEYRFGEAKRERYPDLAAEMVGLKPDVIYVSSTSFI